MGEGNMNGMTELYYNGEKVCAFDEVPDVTEIINDGSIKSYVSGVNAGIEVGKALQIIGYYPDRILKSGNRTIVFWNDGEKTIVKRADGEPDNTYVAFTAAFAKRFFGSNSALNKMIQNRTVYQKPKESDR